MNASSSSHDRELPVFDEDTEAVYSLDVVAELAGVHTRTVLHYQEQGFVRPVADNAGFDAEGLRRLRQIEHLRSTCAVNDSGLRLILDLMREVEQLKQERRERLR